MLAILFRAQCHGIPQDVLQDNSHQQRRQLGVNLRRDMRRHNPCNHSLPHHCWKFPDNNRVV